MNQCPTDNSVLTALSELRTLEDQRLDEERALAAQCKRDEETATLERREGVLHAQRVAEAEARVRVEDESRVRNDDADRRLAALRAELSAVQAERERLHGSLLASVHEPIGARDSSARPWAWAFAASAVVVAGLAAILALGGNRPAPVYVLAPPPAPVIETAPRIAAPATELAAPVAVVTAPVDATPRVRPRAGLGKRGRDVRPTVPHDGLDPVDCDESDPTCGM